MSLSKLLCGIYRPQRGTILLNGVDAIELWAEDRLRLLGIMPQKVPDYRGYTIAEVIAFGDASRPLDRAAVEAAGKAVGADRFIGRLDAGYDTVVGREHGTEERAAFEPSGGQKQLLFLAMQFYRPSLVVLLDEPTAAVDYSGKLRVRRSLRGFRGKRPLILRQEWVHEDDCCHSCFWGPPVDRETECSGRTDLSNCSRIRIHLFTFPFAGGRLSFLERSWFTIFAGKRFAIRVHLSFLLVLFLIGGFGFEPGIWLGVTLFLVAHECGHALIISRCGGRVTSTEFFLFHGTTNYYGAEKGSQPLWVATGGVLGQLALFLVVVGVLLASPEMARILSPGFVRAVTDINLFFLAVELIPYPPLDGARIWPLVSSLFKRGGGRPKLSGITRRDSKRRSDARRKFSVLKGGKNNEENGES